MAKRRTERLTGPALDQHRAELTAVIDRDLDTVAAKAVRALTVVAAASPAPAARELMFEVFEAGNCLSVVYRVLGDGGFGEQLDYGHVLNDAPLPTVTGFGPADVAIEVEWRLVRSALFRRFPQWWVEAGGKRYPLPVRLAEHDMMDEYPLAWAGGPETGP